ncbi:MAG: co-chaperone GroES [Candidatus Goldbacteria bacterium]|nr:co-chaperone GroES [Candidatus Goldiibacteriota bacterium]
MKLQPLNSRVLVRKNETGEKKIGGLYIPDAGNAGISDGIVVEVPQDGIKHIYPGDRVMFKTGSGDEILVNEEKFLLLEEDELIAKAVEMDDIPA